MTSGASSWPVRLALPLAVACALAACGKGQPAEESVESAAPVVVQLAKAGPARVEIQIKASGTTVAAPGAELVVTAPQPARVLAIPHGEGDRVAPGGVLVEFDIPSLSADVATRESALAQARARVASTQAARDRLAGLLDRGVAARREVDDAERDLAEAHASVSEGAAGLGSARRLLSRQRVTAPFDGVVVRRFHNPGDLVDASAADPILRFADPARIEVEALVPASSVARVEAGQAAEVRASAEVRWDATVVRTPAAVDTVSASARVRLALRGGTRPALGLPVETTITVVSRDAPVVIPIAGLLREGDRVSVFVVNGDKAVRRDVRTGLVSDSLAEIASGVRAGETVVVGGLDGLPDGARVSVAP